MAEAAACKHEVGAQGCAQTLQHVIVEQREGAEAASHEQHVLLVQRLLWNLQLTCACTIAGGPI